ncbi:glycosyltransferase family 4 protein [Ectothiorhodospiraceae bacterium 2226]|nr:glycosyltransferase family 4 protein [Ectothiorhodospiraceae bacterium 2226]
MRIVYLHQYFNTPSMPGGTRSYEMARRLVSKGHEVNVITSSRDTNSCGTGWRVTRESGISVHWYPVPYSNSMGFSQRVRAFVQFALAAARRAGRMDCDLVFATSTPLTIALPAAFAARRRGVPMVFEVRDLWPELPVAIGALKNPVGIMLARMLERFAYRNARRVVALSPGMREGVIKAGYPARHVHVVPNSCDLDLFEHAADGGHRFRRTLDWLGDRPLVLYAGTLGAINGVGYLVEVAAAMREILPEARFLIVGEGREEQTVRSKARELGVLDETLFMMSAMPKDRMPEVLGAADVAVSLFIDLPEMWANSANKFFDALAAGRAVAINYGGWQAELLTCSGAGVVLPPNDARVAAERLAGLLGDRDSCREAGLKARQLGEERFSRNRLADELEAVLLEAASGSA